LAAFSSGTGLGVLRYCSSSMDTPSGAFSFTVWIRAPGTPVTAGGDLDTYVRGLAEMYVADERFAANYGGVEGATFVRDALLAQIDRAIGPRDGW